ncbi:hypothetical protein QQ045_001041 [Rhodiola kirilowii]
MVRIETPRPRRRLNREASKKFDGVLLSSGDFLEERKGVITVATLEFLDDLEEKFLFFLYRLKFVHQKLLEVNATLKYHAVLDTEKDTLKLEASEVKKKIGRYVEVLESYEIYYAAEKHDLTMIFLYLKLKKVRIGSHLTDQRVGHLKEYAKSRQITLI